MSKQCSRCGQGMDDSAAFCSKCGAPSPPLGGQAGYPQSPDPYSGRQSPGAPVQQNHTQPGRYGGPQAPYPVAYPPPPPQPRAGRPKRRGILIAAISCGTALVILVAVLLGVMLSGGCSGGAGSRPVPVESTESRVPPSSSTPPAPGADLQTLLDAGQATTYSFATLSDPQYGIEVYRTLLPDGWEATGNVEWDLHDLKAPAVWWMDAKAPGGDAGVFILSDRHYSLDEYETDGVISQVEVAGYPSDLPAQAGVLAEELFNQYMPGGVPGLEFMRSEDLDPGGELLALYTGANDGFSGYTGMGYEMTEVYCKALSAFGMATIGDETYNIQAEIVMAGNTAEMTTGQTTQRIYQWGLMGLNVFYYKAEAALYAQDFALIASNFTVNNNWRAAKSGMSEQLDVLMRANEHIAWSEAGQYAGLAHAKVDVSIEHTNDWTVQESTMADRGFSIWQEQLLGLTPYSLGGMDGRLMVDSLWGSVWISDAGDVIGVNDSTYNPQADPTMNGNGWRLAELG